MSENGRNAICYYKLIWNFLYTMFSTRIYKLFYHVFNIIFFHTIYFCSWWPNCDQWIILCFIWNSTISQYSKHIRYPVIILNGCLSCHLNGCRCCLFWRSNICNNRVCFRCCLFWIILNLYDYMIYRINNFWICIYIINYIMMTKSSNKFIHRAYNWLLR